MPPPPRSFFANACDARYLCFKLGKENRAEASSRGYGRVDGAVIHLAHDLAPILHGVGWVLLDPAQFPSTLSSPSNAISNATTADNAISAAGSAMSIKRAKREERRRKAASRVHAQGGNKLGELDLGARKVQT